MIEEDLLTKMLAFIELQDGDSFDEVYATQREFAAMVLTEFAEYLGANLVVPAYVPQLKKPEIDRNAMLKALLPGITALFNMEYDKRVAENARAIDTDTPGQESP